jgi:hypothetical protein
VLGHKIFMDNSFSLPAVFVDLFERKISACGTFRRDRRGMPQDIGPKDLRLKRGNIMTRDRVNVERQA